MVAVLIPSKGGRKLEVAVVTCVWKSQKKPKLVTTACPLNHLVAFRCFEMSPVSDNVARWETTEASRAWVMKPEALVAVLAPASPESFKMELEGLQVQLSGESIQILDQVSTAASWWPLMEEDVNSKQPGGLYLPRKRGRAAKAKGGAKAVAKRAKRGMGQDDGVDGVDGDEGAGALRLKRSTAKTITFMEENCTRTADGRVLVEQMMVRLKQMEQRNFPDHSPVFDQDGKCQVRHDKCKGVSWEDILANAFSYMCAEYLSCHQKQNPQDCDFLELLWASGNNVLKCFEMF